MSTNGSAHTALVAHRDGTLGAPADDSTFERLREWADKCMRAGPPGKVILVQASGGGRLQNLQEWDDFTDISPEDLASKIDHTADEDARFAHGAPLYAVLWYRKGEESRPYASRISFRKRGGAEEFDGVEESEGPSAQGLVAQAMRHTEFFARHGMIQVHTAMQMLQRENAELRRSNQMYMEKHARVIEVMERLMSEEQTRRLELRKAALGEVRSEKLWEMVMILAPLALRHFAVNKGQKSTEEFATAQMLSGLMSSLSEKQMQMIVGNLNPAQQAGIFEHYKKNRSQSPEPVAKKVDEKAEKIRAEAETMVSEVHPMPGEEKKEGAP